VSPGRGQRPGGARLNRALEIVNRYGCYGCHKMRGFENRPKVAPTLMHPTSKLTTEWMGRWIKNPKAFRPSTRMPRFFGLENNQAPGDADREDAEITGIVAYLAEKAEKRSYPPLPGRGDAERGRKLVKSIGCMGCHAIERDDVPAETLQRATTVIRPTRSPGNAVSDRTCRDRKQGEPRVDLSVDPESRQYNPDTRMPNLRLTSQEALDITAFLTTLKDDTPSERRVAPVGPRPQARDAALLAYLSQRMPPQEAQAKLAAMTEHDRDVLLGERTISRYGCFGCHLIPGFEKTPPIGTDLSEEGSKPADLLLFGFMQIEHTSPAWFYQKMKEPRSFDQGHVAEFYDRLRMPQFGFTDEMADAVTLLLQGLTKEKMPLESMRRLSARDEAVEAGRRLVRDYNCQGCHILEGKGGAIRESIAKNLQAKGCRRRRR